MTKQDKQIYQDGWDKGERNANNCWRAAVEERIRIIDIAERHAPLNVAAKRERKAFQELKQRMGGGGMKLTEEQKEGNRQMNSLKDYRLGQQNKHNQWLAAIDEMIGKLNNQSSACDADDWDSSGMYLSRIFILKKLLDRMKVEND